MSCNLYENKTTCLVFMIYHLCNYGGFKNKAALALTEEKYRIAQVTLLKGTHKLNVSLT